MILIQFYCIQILNIYIFIASHLIFRQFKTAEDVPAPYKNDTKVLLGIVHEIFSLFFILMLHAIQLFPSTTNVFFFSILNQLIFYHSYKYSFIKNQPYLAITVFNKYYVFSFITIYITFIYMVLPYFIVRWNCCFLHIMKHNAIVTEPI